MKGLREKVASRTDEKEIVVDELEKLMWSDTQSFWSAKDVAILRRYFPRRVPVEALAKTLHRTTAAVKSKVRDLGLKRMSRAELESREYLKD